jgi:hypothetical protein
MQVRPIGRFCLALSGAGILSGCVLQWMGGPPGTTEYSFKLDQAVVWLWPMGRRLRQTHRTFLLRNNTRGQFSRLGAWSLIAAHRMTLAPQGPISATQSQA